jgi:hypothetical protein
MGFEKETIATHESAGLLRIFFMQQKKRFTATVYRSRQVGRRGQESSSRQSAPSAILTDTTGTRPKRHVRKMIKSRAPSTDNTTASINPVSGKTGGSAALARNTNHGKSSESRYRASAVMPINLYETGTSGLVLLRCRQASKTSIQQHFRPDGRYGLRVQVPTPITVSVGVTWR